MEELIPVRQAAEEYGINYATLSRYAREGKIPATRQGQKMFVSRQVLNTYFERHSARPKQGKPPEKVPEKPLDDTCPKCKRVNPPCGWALPFQWDDDYPIEIVCQKCFNEMLEAA